MSQLNEPLFVPAAADAGSMDTTLTLAEHWRVLVGGSLLAGLVALGITFVVPYTYTARTSFLPPQQQGGGGAAAAISSLGALANLAGAGGTRTPADQYVALLQSTTIEDRLVDRFKLVEVYDDKYRMDARRDLSDNARITLSKRDGIITVEIDDHSPVRAAEIANAHVEELRRLVSTLAISEAQQRRVFFDRLLLQTRDKLTAAQVALQGSGFTEGTLKSEPKTAAEAYAKLLAQATAAEVRLQALRSTLHDGAPEIRQQESVLSALRAQIARNESTDRSSGGPDYIGKYREFKYQETLFELYAKQLEAARVDEAREGGLIQVIDVAQPPEKKSRPKRSLVSLGAAAGTALLLGAWFLTARTREALRRSWRARREQKSPRA